MATVEHPTSSSAEAHAWELFFEALDGSTPSASDVPPGAAIVAADAPDLDELVRRYHADGRSVVVVSADGTKEVRRPRHTERMFLGGLLIAMIAWVASRRRGVISH